MMKTTLTILTLLVASCCYSNPTVFGIEVSRTSLEEARQLLGPLGYQYYDPYGSGSYVVSMGKIKRLNIEGLDELRLFCQSIDGRDVVTAIEAVFNGNAYERLSPILLSKYQKNLGASPDPENLQLFMKDGDTHIVLSHRKGGGWTNLTYSSEQFRLHVVEHERKHRAQLSKHL